jgi:hypothetical protein
MSFVRLTWHPLTIGVLIVAVAAVAAVVGLPPSLWLVMGAAAGFATSGST